MSMTRQEQLDAVVRNYGEWEDRFEWAFLLHGRVKFTNNKDAVSLPLFTRAEVEQRKAELQNKPSWDDAPINAESLIQSDKGDWEWIVRIENLAAALPRYEIEPQYSGYSGEVIGDWRDTLENRPK